jgi:hypothetical protein
MWQTRGDAKRARADAVRARDLFEQCGARRDLAGLDRLI